MLRIDERKKEIALSVKDLVYFGFGRMTGKKDPKPGRTTLGKSAHEEHQSARKEELAGYRAEYFLKHETEVLGYRVTLRGRIDGLLEKGSELLVEEVKSVVMAEDDFLGATVENFKSYGMQLKLYCHLLMQSGMARGKKLSARLVLSNLLDDSKRSLEVVYRKKEAEEFIERKIGMVLSELDRKESRNEVLRAQADMLRFPYPEVRRFQDRMIREVYRALKEKRDLLVSAPTGIGKTAGALYPAMKFGFESGLKLFFVTAKTTQQKLVMDILENMREASNVDFAAVVLRAKEKMCPNDVCFCQEEICPYIADLDWNLQRTNLVEEMLKRRVIEPEDIFSEGVKHNICPFELSLSLSEHADIIVGDYNYVFDPNVALKRFFEDKAYDHFVLVVDEAHNLYSRAREYYSPELSSQEMDRLIEMLKRRKKKLFKDFRALFREIRAELERMYGDAGFEDCGKSLTGIDKEFFRKKREEMEHLASRYFLHRKKSGKLGLHDPIDDFYFLFSRFVNVLGMEGDEFSYIIERNAVGEERQKKSGGEDVGVKERDGGKGDKVLYKKSKRTGRRERAKGTIDGGPVEIRLKILCKDPSNQLGKRISGFYSSIAMSATLEPFGFYRSVLGFGKNAKGISLPSPFPKRNRKIAVIPEVSTKYSRRDMHYGRIAEIISEIVRLKRGNYIAFFPSFAFMRNVAGYLSGNFSEHSSRTSLSVERGGSGSLYKKSSMPVPGGVGNVSDFSPSGDGGDIEILYQKSFMTDAERNRFIARLKRTDQGKSRVVMAVQGGIFSEGVDYPGEMLIGAIVISPALPLYCFEQELVKGYFDEKYGQGFEYAYLYPGMNRVIQSAGRVIRSSEDVGIIALVGERFAQRRYSSVFPKHWYVHSPRELISGDFGREFWRFWRGKEVPEGQDEKVTVADELHNG